MATGPLRLATARSRHDQPVPARQGCAVDPAARSSATTGR